MLPLKKLYSVELCKSCYSLKDDDLKLVDVEPSIATSEVECLPEDIFTKPVELAHGKVVL